MKADAKGQYLLSDLEDTVGTIDHMAPELLDIRLAHKTFSFGSDVYALVVVVGSVLLMDLPWSQTLRGWEIRTLVGQQNQRPFDLDLLGFSSHTAYQSTQGRHLIQVLKQGWQADSSKRASAKQVLSALSHFKDTLTQEGRTREAQSGSRLTESPLTM